MLLVILMSVPRLWLLATSCSVAVVVLVARLDDATTFAVGFEASDPPANTLGDGLIKDRLWSPTEGSSIARIIKLLLFD